MIMIGGGLRCIFRKTGAICCIACFKLVPPAESHQACDSTAHYLLNGAKNGGFPFSNISIRTRSPCLKNSVWG